MQSFIESHAIYAIIVLGVLEAMCIPWSSEVTFLIGGAVASGGLAAATQHPSLIEVIVLGTFAEVVGSYVAYYVGRKGGKPLVRRWGRYVLITESDVARAERFLVGRGVWAVPVARIMPFIRSFSSIVVGLVDVPPVRFGILNLIGTFIYVIVVSSIGYSLGSEWSKFDHVFSKVSYVIAAVVVVALVYFVVHRVREFKREAAALSSQEPAPGQPRNSSSYDQQYGQRPQDQQYGQRPQDQQYGQRPQASSTGNSRTTASSTGSTGSRRETSRSTAASSRISSTASRGTSPTAPTASRGATTRGTGPGGSPPILACVTGRVRPGRRPRYSAGRAPRPSAARPGQR